MTPTPQSPTAGEPKSAGSEFFWSGETYDRTITHPDTGTTFEVTLRPLMAGDRAEIQDAVRMSMIVNDEDDELDLDDVDEEKRQRITRSTELRMGTMQQLTVAAAVVGWTLPVAPNKNTIRRLHPACFDQIYAEVSWGGVPKEKPSPEEKSGDPLPGSTGSSSKPAVEEPEQNS